MFIQQSPKSVPQIGIAPASNAALINQFSFRRNVHYFKIFYSNKPGAIHISKGKTSEIKGFSSKKTGKSFSAILVLQDKTSGKVGFEFNHNGK